MAGGGGGGSILSGGGTVVTAATSASAPPQQSVGGVVYGNGVPGNVIAPVSVVVSLPGSGVGGTVSTGGSAAGVLVSQHPGQALSNYGPI